MAYKHTAAPNLPGELLFKDAFHPGFDLGVRPGFPFAVPSALGSLDAPAFLCAGACEWYEQGNLPRGGFAVQQLSRRD